MNNRRILLCSLIFASIVLPGCGSRVAYHQRNFLLEVSRNLPLQKTSKDMILDVQGFSIAKAFSTKSLVYRKGQSEYETDFYNQFLIMPEDMVTQKTRAWLSDSGLFKWVLEPGSYMDATHTLEGNIIALYGDFRDQSQPKAKMEIRFFVIKLSDKSIIFGKTYNAVSDVEILTAEGVIAAFDKCLTTILSNLERDFEKQL